MVIAKEGRLQAERKPIPDRLVAGREERAGGGGSCGVPRRAVGKGGGDGGAGGSRALQGKRRGRPPVPRLAPGQVARIVRLIVDRCPDQLRLPFRLLTRGAGGQALTREL